MPQAQARAQMGDQFRLHFLSPVGLSPGPFLASSSWLALRLLPYPMCLWLDCSKLLSGFLPSS